jgi:hypothetical protein
MFTRGLFEWREIDGHRFVHVSNFEQNQDRGRKQQNVSSKCQQSVGEVSEKCQGSVEEMSQKCRTVVDTERLASKISGKALSRNVNVKEKDQRSVSVRVNGLDLGGGGAASPPTNGTQRNGNGGIVSAGQVAASIIQGIQNANTTERNETEQSCSKQDCILDALDDRCRHLAGTDYSSVTVPLSSVGWWGCRPAPPKV